MITVNINNQSWKLKVQKELEQIGFKIKKNSCIFDESCKFQIGSRTFKFDKNFTKWNGPKKILKTDAAQFKFDDEKFKHYIAELDEKKIELKSNRNAFKFQKEFFTIRLVGELKKIHSSFGDYSNWIRVIKHYGLKFKMFNCDFLIDKNFKYSYDELNDIDFWNETYELEIDHRNIGEFSIEEILNRLRKIVPSFDQHEIEMNNATDELNKLNFEINSATNYIDRNWYTNEKLKIERETHNKKIDFKRRI